MEYEHALAFVRRAGVGIVQNRENNVIGIAIGNAAEGPITATQPNDFSVVAHVARFVPDEPAARQRAISACVTAGRTVTFDIAPDNVKVAEVGDVFRALAYTGSDHGKPALINTQKWFKALRPGIGIANADGYPDALRAGTIGFFVTQNDRRYLVSCNHVIARANEGLTGEPIVQPATLDLSGSDLSDHLLADIRRRFLVAELAGFIPIRRDDPSVSPAPVNTVDLALAEIAVSNRDKAFGRLPYAGRIFGEADPYRLDDSGAIVGSAQVYKVGRTTGFTEGYVSELAGTLQVHYDGWTATFVNQIVVSRTVDNTGTVFSDNGDSGSALLTEEHRIAGLIFAGGPRRTLANPIDQVMADLQTLVGPSALTIIN
jgi:hypothetical protein